MTPGADQPGPLGHARHEGEAAEHDEEEAPADGLEPAVELLLPGVVRRSSSTCVLRGRAADSKG